MRLNFLSVALNMASRMAGVGWVTVSLRKSGMGGSLVKKPPMVSAAALPCRLRGAYGLAILQSVPCASSLPV